MGIKWVKLDSVHSTNSYISDLVKHKQSPEELLVTTDYQKDGRGQGDHSWHSERGKNLLMSLLLFPAFLSASNQFQLSKVASLSVCDTLAEEEVDSLIKWPNDILTVRGKMAGILIEHGIMGGNISHSIIGIGLNLNQTKFPPFPVSATSLALEKGINREPHVMAEKLTKRVMARYDKLRSGMGEAIEQDYLQRLYMLDKPAIFIAGEIEFMGKIKGVNDCGELLVETGGKIKSFSHQEIKYSVASA